MTRHSIQIWTDGACLGNPGPGGWAAVIKNGSDTKEISGGTADTTNNRMELTAAIAALAELPGSVCAVVHTDSIYVRDGLTRWLPNWRKKNWRTARGKPVKNRDLWQELADQDKRVSVRWVWVKAHAGNPNNERADSLARQQAQEAAAGL